MSKAKVSLPLKSKMARFIKEAKITEAMLKNIDNPDGTGSMILVRLLNKEEGRILVNTLKDVRNALGLRVAKRLRYGCWGANSGPPMAP